MMIGMKCCVSMRSYDV